MPAASLLPEGSYFTTVAGHRIHYIDRGSGSAVLFLHGSGPGASGYSNFKGNYPWLCDKGNCRTVVPDLPGFGLSDKPEDVEYHIDLFVNSMISLLDHLKIDHCTLIGNSLGGAIALQMALDHPQRVASLILMAPGGLEQQEAYFKMPGMQVMREFYTGGQEVSETSMATLLKNLSFLPDIVDDELVAERLAVFKTQNSQLMATLKVPEVTSRLCEIRCKTLVFWGANDRFMPLSGIAKLAGGIDRCQVIIQSRCGHWFMAEYSQLFNRCCLQFIQNRNGW